ncbi:hypothetical protein K438DRAFT_1784320 [Mycena galopus ATCC 62051]|nr:hypothetical protein K438DRAFT_1784320 [Mycena galopus ATCC 62051]
MTTTTTTLFPSPPAAAFSLPARSLRGHHATVARHIPNPSPSSLSHRRWGSLVTVSPPLPPPSPPPSSTPTAVTAAAPPATEPTVSVASKKARRPNPIHFTPWNLYMAVYADEVGGPLTNLPCTGRVWRPRIRVCFRIGNVLLAVIWALSHMHLQKLQMLPHIPATQDIRQHIQAIL